MTVDTTDATTTVAPGTWACPASKLVLRADAPREEWLAMRKVGLGGSDAAALMGDNHYDDGTPYFVWLDKTSPTEGDDLAKRNKAMARGHAMEPIVRELFEQESGLKTRRQGLHQSREYPTILASVDALSSDGGGAEFKTATSYSIKAWPEDWKYGVCPPLYAWQAKHYMLVTGRSHWWVAALIIDTWELVIWRIDRDEEELELLAVVETEFWRTYVEPGVAPEVDLGVMTTAEVSARWPSATENLLVLEEGGELASRVRELILDRRALAAEIKEAEAQEKAASDELRSIAQAHAEIHIGTRKAFTFKDSSTRRLNAEVLLEAYPDVDIEKCKKLSTGRTLRLDTKIFK